MTWTDPNTVHTPTTGNVIPASWGAMVNQNLLHLRNSNETAAAYRNTPRTINHDTVTALEFTTELWDNANMWVSTSPTQFRAPVDGIYLFTVFVSFDAHSTGHRTVWLLASTGVTFGAYRQNAASIGKTDVCCSGVVHLAADDYVVVRVVQNSGGPLNVIEARASLVRLSG